MWLDRSATTSSPIPAQARKTAQELEAALNKALQTRPECSGLTVRKVTRLDNNQGLANWDADCAAEPGVTISAECKRVFLPRKARRAETL